MPEVDFSKFRKSGSNRSVIPLVGPVVGPPEPDRPRPDPDRSDRPRKRQKEKGIVEWLKFIDRDPIQKLRLFECVYMEIIGRGSGKKSRYMLKKIHNTKSEMGLPIPADEIKKVKGLTGGGTGFEALDALRALIKMAEEDGF